MVAATAAFHKRKSRFANLPPTEIGRHFRWHKTGETKSRFPRPQSTILPRGACCCWLLVLLLLGLPLWLVARGRTLCNCVTKFLSGLPAHLAQIVVIVAFQCSRWCIDNRTWIIFSARKVKSGSKKVSLQPFDILFGRSIAAPVVLHKLGFGGHCTFVVALQLHRFWGSVRSA